MQVNPVQSGFFLGGYYGTNTMGKLGEDNNYYRFGDR